MKHKLCICIYYRFDVPDGVLICSVDNMPAQMAYEATSDFGDLVLPLAMDMVSPLICFIKLWKINDTLIISLGSWC